MRQKQKVSFEWNPYPEYKPNRDDVFIISIDPRGTPLSFYSVEEDYFEGFNPPSNSVIKLDNVLAWAEMPKGYKNG